MAYALHITRSANSPELTLEEWGQAVDAIKILRFNSDSMVARNPRTGAEVKVPGNPGDVEMYLEDEKEWMRVFDWCDGSVSFNACAVTPEVWRIVTQLANKLGAEIRGEEDELYTAESWPKPHRR